MNPVPIWSAILTPPKPTSLRLDLQFAADQSYVSRRGPLPTFSRTTAGTFVGSNGLIQSAAIDVPRIDFDPATLACRGLLIEEGRTNLAIWSEKPSNAQWFKSQVTVAVNQGISPYGTLDADLISETTANTQHFYTSTAVNVTTGTTYTASVFIKKGTGATAPDWISLSTAWSNYTRACAFNVTTGATASISPLLTVYVEQYPSGWWRVSLTTASTVTNSQGQILFGFTNNTAVPIIPIYVGSVTSDIFVWGAQFEAGAFATSYIPTTAGTGSRTADLCSITGAAFTGFWNASEGTLVVKAELASVGPLLQGYAFISDGTISNRIALRHTNTPVEQYFVNSSGTNVANINLPGVAANTNIGFAVRYKLNDFAASLSGGSVSTDTSGLVPTVSQIEIGNELGNWQLNGWIQAIQYYNVIKTNAQLQALSLP